MQLRVAENIYGPAGTVEAVACGKTARTGVRKRLEEECVRKEMRVWTVRAGSSPRATCNGSLNYCIWLAQLAEGGSLAMPVHQISREGLASEVRLLEAAGSLPTRRGHLQTKVMEDIWFGSLLFR